MQRICVYFIEKSQFLVVLGFFFFLLSALHVVMMMLCEIFGFFFFFECKTIAVNICEVFRHKNTRNLFSMFVKKKRGKPRSASEAKLLCCVCRSFGWFLDGNVLVVSVVFFVCLFYYYFYFFISLLCVTCMFCIFSCPSSLNSTADFVEMSLIKF